MSYDIQPVMEVLEKHNYFQSPRVHAIWKSECRPQAYVEKAFLWRVLRIAVLVKPFYTFVSQFRIEVFAYLIKMRRNIFGKLKLNGLVVYQYNISTFF